MVNVDGTSNVFSPVQPANEYIFNVFKPSGNFTDFTVVL